jgi:SlyX protein
MESEERLANLESTVAFQDRTIEQLSQVVTALVGRIDRLEAELKNALDRLGSETPLVRDIAEEEPPPHY